MTPVGRLGALLAAVLVAVATVAVVQDRGEAIVGGNRSPAPYSFMGSLQRLDSPRDDLHVCGVSLIAPTWGLTAGHCTRTAADVIDEPTSGHPRGWQVRFGSTRVDAGGTLVDVAQFVQLNNRYFDRDLALLRLAEPVPSAPIPIADTSPRPGTPVRIMGWGLTCRDVSKSRCLPRRLQEADTKIQPRRTCDAPNADLCVGPLSGQVGPENMDSGGPAVVMQDGQWQLVGSVEGAGYGEPSIYTNVTEYRDWIDAHVSGRTPIPPDTPFPSRWLDGTVKLGGCTGAVFRSARSQASDPAMVLTNGHCAMPRPAPGEAVVDRSNRQLALILDRNGEPALRAYTTRLVYATMTGTDVAVYRLDKSYRELHAAGTTIRSLAAGGPRTGQRVRVLSGTSGKHWRCTVQAIVPTLAEAAYTQRRAIRYRSEPGCGPRSEDGPGHGDSGSPLVDLRTGRILGVHATGNDQGRRCTQDNPCEIDANGQVSSVKGRRYGQQTSALTFCLAPGSAVDFSRPRCTLVEPARR